VNSVPRSCRHEHRADAVCVPPSRGRSRNTSGKCPNTVAADVINTGRSRVNDASRSATSFATPCACSAFANWSDQNSVLRYQSDQRDQPTCE